MTKAAETNGFQTTSNEQPEKRTASGKNHPSTRPFVQVRKSRGTSLYRALGIMEGDTVAWFWASSHEEYERQF
jgi:hypothetical protein